MRKSQLVGYTLATAAALSFAAAPVSTASAATANVACYGVNGCRGQAECKTAKNSCKAQNDCKGQGFMSMSAADCTSTGGTTKPPAA